MRSQPRSLSDNAVIRVTLRNFAIRVPRAMKTTFRSLCVKRLKSQSFVTGITSRMNNGVALITGRQSRNGSIKRLRDGLYLYDSLDYPTWNA
jgi:hypothetical protein